MTSAKRVLGSLERPEFSVARRQKGSRGTLSVLLRRTPEWKYVPIRGTALL